MKKYKPIPSFVFPFFLCAYDNDLLKGRYLYMIIHYFLYIPTLLCQGDSCLKIQLKNTLILKIFSYVNSQLLWWSQTFVSKAVYFPSFGMMQLLQIILILSITFFFPVLYNVKNDQWQYYSSVNLVSRLHNLAYTKTWTNYLTHRHPK